VAGTAVQRLAPDQVNATLDDKKLAAYVHANTFHTVLGAIKFGKDGEWDRARMLQVQFYDVKGNGLAHGVSHSPQSGRDSAPD
jgi:hypothetical protein